MTALLSPAEQRFDAIRHRIGRYAGPVGFFAVLFTPMPGLSDDAHRVAAVSVLAVIWWVTEAIPLAVTALVAPALAVLLGASSADAAFAPFAHPLIFLFLGGFLLAEGLMAQGFDRRAALWLLSHRIVAGSPNRAALLVCLGAFGFSMWISNTATTAMMIPIVVGLASTMEDLCAPGHRRAMERHSEGMLITMAYATSLGGMSTPVGTAPNMIALAALRDHLGIRIDFLQWMSFALPTSLVALGLMLVLARRRFATPVERIEGLTDHVRQQLEALGPMTRGERAAIAMFGLAIAGWIAPAIFRLALGAEHEWTTWAREALNEGVVAMICASLLFLLPATKSPAEQYAVRPPILTWQRAARIDWGTLFLLGGGLALGNLVFESGLANAIGTSVLSLTDGSPPHWRGVIVLVASTTLVLFMTEVTSNTATTSMMLPVIISIGTSLGIEPLPIVLAVTLAASCAFMLPVSTPPNAIAYGTGRIRIGSMVRFGFELDLVELALLISVSTLLLPLLAFA